MNPRQNSSKSPEEGKLRDHSKRHRRLADEEVESPSAYQQLQPFIGIADSGGQQLSQGTGTQLREFLEEKKTRAEQYSSEDVHRALFEEPPEPQTLEELKEGVRRSVKARPIRR